jgi:AP2 domain
MPKSRVRRHEIVQPLDQSIRLIPLTQGQNAIVDAADYDWLNQWNWTAYWDPAIRTFRVVRRSNGHILHMSRVITECTFSEYADHKNHDTLDNRRENLRRASKSQNACNRRRTSQNSSGFIGVTWNKARKKWQAQIQIKRKYIHLGLFRDKQQAARVRDEAAKQHHGEFAFLNSHFT